MKLGAECFSVLMAAMAAVAGHAPAGCTVLQPKAADTGQEKVVGDGSGRDSGLGDSMPGSGTDAGLRNAYEVLELAKQAEVEASAQLFENMALLLLALTQRGIGGGAHALSWMLRRMDEVSAPPSLGLVEAVCRLAAACGGETAAELAWQLWRDFVSPVDLTPQICEAALCAVCAGGGNHTRALVVIEALRRRRALSVRLFQAAADAARDGETVAWLRRVMASMRIPGELRLAQDAVAGGEESVAVTPPAAGLEDGSCDRGTARAGLQEGADTRPNPAALDSPNATPPAAGRAALDSPSATGRGMPLSKALLRLRPLLLPIMVAAAATAHLRMGKATERREATRKVARVSERRAAKAGGVTGRDGAGNAGLGGVELVDWVADSAFDAKS